mmetsp:Transcript_21648/g.19199  ORF Transcript_21648/g.19199 Transcript_21648/m.19199 type:complete len:178 (+) Transcript_21648:123-656(+)
MDRKENIQSIKLNFKTNLQGNLDNNVSYLLPIKKSAMTDFKYKSRISDLDKGYLYKKSFNKSKIRITDDMQILKQKGYINQQAKIKKYETTKRKMNSFNNRYNTGNITDKQVIWKPLVGSSNAIYLPDPYKNQRASNGLIYNDQIFNSQDISKSDNFSSQSSLPCNYGETMQSKYQL